MMGPRVYLDWNATAPLRPEARAAMAAALDVVGNPSSIHAEGRAARAIVERARAQVAAATGCVAGDVVFTSGATEAAALALAGRGLHGAPVEHDCVAAWVSADLPVDATGRVGVTDPAASVLQAANSETGVMQELPRTLACVDAVQVVGRLPFAFRLERCAGGDRVGAQARRTAGGRGSAVGARGGDGSGAARRRTGIGTAGRH